MIENRFERESGTVLLENRTDKTLNALTTLIDHLSIDLECAVIKNHLAVLKNDVAA